MALEMVVFFFLERKLTVSFSLQRRALRYSEFIFLVEASSTHLELNLREKYRMGFALSASHTHSRSISQ